MSSERVDPGRAAPLFGGPPPSSLGAAAFLACSWIWVIAMLLPTLLVHDYGVPGWVVFAVPNVIGAGAVGFLAASRSGRLLSEHRRLCRTFSLVVVALHTFVGVWLLVASRERLLPLGLAALLCAVLARARTWRQWGSAAALLYALSIALLALHFVASPPALELGEPRLGTAQLLLFAIASFLGFLVCPFLDPSLLSASQAARNPRAAFSLGFGVLFLAAIVAAPLYAPSLVPLFEGAPSPLEISTPLLLFVVLQASFTLVLHVRCAAALSSSPAGRSFVAPGVMVLLGAVLGALGPLEVAERLGVATAGELTYRSFLVLFGIALPGWLLWSRLWPGHQRRLRAWTLGAATLMGAVFFVRASVASGLLALASLLVGVATERMVAARGRGRP